MKVYDYGYYNVKVVDIKYYKICNKTGGIVMGSVIILFSIITFLYILIKQTKKAYQLLNTCQLKFRI